jgi:hypothetical protein
MSKDEDRDCSILIYHSSVINSSGAGRVDRVYAVPGGAARLRPGVNGRPARSGPSANLRRGRGPTSPVGPPVVWPRPPVPGASRGRSTCFDSATALRPWGTRRRRERRRCLSPGSTAPARIRAVLGFTPGKAQDRPFRTYDEQALPSVPECGEENGPVLERGVPDDDRQQPLSHGSGSRAAVRPAGGVATIVATGAARRESSKKGVWGKAMARGGFGTRQRERDGPREKGWAGPDGRRPLRRMAQPRGGR